MIKNEEGLVVLKFFQPMDKLVKVGTNHYWFSSQHGISLGFFNEVDVPKLLQVQGGCCGKKQFIITEATETQYEHWKFGKGGRK